MIRKTVFAVGVLILAAFISGCGGTYTLLRGGEDATDGREQAAAQQTEGPDAGETADPEGSAQRPETEPSKETGQQPGGMQDVESTSQLIYVYVCGAVRAPGVYTLPPGSRIFEAVEAAGGLAEDADARSLNQAGILEDGQQITVYTEEEAAAGSTGNASSGGGGSGPAGGGNALVNLNTAGAEELMTLPGIGEARAASIIAYREQNGAFSTVEDVMKIDGIKEKAFAKLKDFITV